MEAVPAFLALQDGKVVATATIDGFGGRVMAAATSAAQATAP